MAPPRRYSRKRSVVSFDRAQVADVTSRDAIGGDQHNHGIDPDQTFDLVRFFWEDRQQRDIRRAELDQTLQDMRDQIELYRITLAQRIAAVTKAVEDLAAASARQAEESRRLRRWLVLLAALLAGVVVVEAALVWREVALAARALFDTSIPTLAFWRPR